MKAVAQHTEEEELAVEGGLFVRPVPESSSEVSKPQSLQREQDKVNATQDKATTNCIVVSRPACK